MPKGNHVFNHYNKTVENAFKAFLDAAGLTTVMGIKINLATAKGASGSADAMALAGRLPKAWPKFKEIVTAPAFGHWDEMQDNEEVGEDDPNSLLYGQAAGGFVREVAKIASPGTRNAARPGFFWSQMNNVGFDALAAERFIGGNRGRKDLVEATQLWVKGPLNSMVTTWIQYLKLDMDGKK